MDLNKKTCPLLRENRLSTGAVRFELTTKVLETHVLPLHHAPKCRRYYTPILRSCQFFLDDFSNFRCQSCIIKKGQSGRASPGKRDVKLWGGEDGSRKGSIGGDGRARGNDFCGFALEGWPFCRLYGIVMVLRRGME